MIATANKDACAKKESYVDEYLSLMDNLTAKYHSRLWFSTFTASKSREASRFFEELYNIACGKETPSGKSLPRFSFPRFFAISLMRTARMWLRAAAAKLIFFQVFRRIDAGKGICLVRSWLYLKSVDHNGQYTDQFFGVLPKYLRDNGRNVVIVGAVFSDKYLGVIKRIRSANNIAVLPQEYFVSFSDPLRIFMDILKYRTRIDGEITFRNRDVSNLIASHVGRDFTDTAFEQLASFYLTKNMMRKLKVDTYIFTYENNPWEKMALDAIKTYSPSTETIGYQHTIVSLGKMGMRLGENEKRFMPFPDRIVTNGTITKDMLVHHGHYPANKISAGCALRFNVNVTARNERPRSHNGGTILVAPTALYQSIEILNIAYKAFKGRTDWKVIIRIHPGFPLKKIEERLDVPLKAFPSNFVISNRAKVEDDLRESDFMIYDESSLCLNALLMGVPAIYINTDRIVSIDPLFECNNLKREARDSSEVLSVIRLFQEMDNETFMRERFLARQYAVAYLKEVSEEVLKVFL